MASGIDADVERRPDQYRKLRAKLLKNEGRETNEWYIKMREILKKRSAQSYYEKKASNQTVQSPSNNKPTNDRMLPTQKSTPRTPPRQQHSNGSSGNNNQVKNRRQANHRNSNTGSPIVAKQDAMYLCERALRLQLYRGSMDPSTAGCSTITQDIELESCSSDKASTVEVDGSSASSHNSLGSSIYAVRNSIDKDKEDLPESTKMSNNEDRMCDFDEIPINCRVSNRYSGPEGMGPVSAGKITALRHGSQLLAAGTETGRIFIISTEDLSAKPTLLQNNHNSQVIDLVWSESGQCLLSTSLDKTIRIWWIESESETRCVRVIQEPGVPICVLFTPGNNNVFLVGTASSFLKFYNLSTGKVLKKHKLKRSSGCMAWGQESSILCIADTSGRVSSCYYDFMNHNVKRISTVTLERGAPVTSLSRKDNLLLANIMCDSVYLLKLCPKAPYAISIMNKVCVPHQRAILRSSFCPEELLFATGSEDGTVRMVQHTTSSTSGSSSRPQVLKLQGHQGAVLNVAVSEKGNIASGDELGCVMIWKYEKQSASTLCKRESSIQDGSEDKS